MKQHPNQLSCGNNNLVVALSDAEVAKVFTGDTRSDIGSEAEKMKFANAVNGLVAQFIRLDYDEANDWDMLVMERLYPLDFRTMELARRELVIDVFEDELRELHRAGFVHHDLRRPSHSSGERYDNILLTDRGLRLIDVGISALRSQVGELLFGKYVEVELRELAEFRGYFLGR